MTPTEKFHVGVIITPADLERARIIDEEMKRLLDMVDSYDATRRLRAYKHAVHTHGRDPSTENLEDLEDALEQGGDYRNVRERLRWKQMRKAALNTLWACYLDKVGDFIDSIAPRVQAHISAAIREQSDREAIWRMQDFQKWEQWAEHYAAPFVRPDSLCSFLQGKAFSIGNAFERMKSRESFPIGTLPPSIGDVLKVCEVEFEITYKSEPLPAQPQHAQLSETATAAA